MNNKRRLKLFSILITNLAILFSFIISLFSTKFVKAADITDPSSYYEWTQMDMSQPWNKEFGKNNGLCYVVSIAVQGARNGIVKIHGKPWNPSSVANGQQCGTTSYPGCVTKDGKTVTFEAKKIYGQAGGDCTQNPKLTSPSPSTAITNLEKAGLFPIIHIDAAAGWTKYGGTHYMAVREYDGHGTLSLYDPARTANYNTMKDAGGQQALLSKVAVVFGYGGGPVPFNKAPSKEPTLSGGGGDKPSENGKSDNQDSHKNSDVSKIKGIFNPFVDPKQVNPYLGYNTNVKNSAFDRGSFLTFLDNWGPRILLWVQHAALFIMCFFIGYSIIAFLLFWVDNYFTGGYISDFLSNHIDQDNILYKLIFPGDGRAMFGFQPGHNWAVNGLTHDIIMMATVLVVCILVATNSLAIFLGHIFYWLGNIKF